MNEMSTSFSVPPQCILRENPNGENHLSNPGGQWLPGAFVNPAKNCLSVNSKRSLDDIVIRWCDEGDGGLPVKSMTLKELRAEVWYGIFHLYAVIFILFLFNPFIDASLIVLLNGLWA